jgi:hypothetical protein
MVRRSTAVIKQRADARAVHIDTRHDFSFSAPLPHFVADHAHQNE